ncbi:MULTISPECIES: HEAT repeat domain-containing protein [unclassified Sphingomonas]|jgi:HEAT repeat protein|uniref:HEAT repeat domain-containing protein n=1 Tax=unclassified Sphingomonas TaxID=196159 RepID=UPI001782ADBA|nr:MULTISPECIES: HEAT repeat domain-containing protein [unclassified Sphingomonas]MBD8641658.1 HEAT repeat domain-containing protein [Sphingomonas sp. CFBP 13733]MBD8702116.1 HEAT repeat domain-containing protein [Sphingomonas sp. CFBP 13714]
MTSPVDDIRSIADLWKAAFQADDDAAWNAVAALHWRGSKEVLDRAVALTRSSDPASRARGADVLGQLGLPERTFPEESFSAVLPLLKDEVLTVVYDAIYALQHVDRVRAAAHIIPFADHWDDNIRHAVAFGLGAVDTQEARQALLKLMTDCEPDVRNWATFGIGQLTDVDTDQIRAALAVALSDDDAHVRYEGIIGLGRRRDSRAVPYLKLLLHEDPDDIFAREATAKVLGLNESGQIATAELLGALQRLQRWSGGSLPRSM